MMAQFLKLRSPLAALLAVGAAFSSLTAEDRLPVPPAPAPALTSGEAIGPVIRESGAGAPLLAPVAHSEPRLMPGPIIPASRNVTETLYAPAEIEGEPAYIPGSASNAAQLYPVSSPFVSPVAGTEPIPDGGVITYGEEFVIGGGPVNEATVRISDRPADQVGPAPPGVRPSSRICPECRYCQHGLPYHQCQECEIDPRLVQQYRRRHGIVYPPDYGWSPPARHPIDRVSIDYYRAFPAAWNGQQAARPAVVRPTVYWPTDTTQLGYTYQHTPRWMPYPGMVPPVPHPAQWHVPLYSNQNGPCPQYRGNAAWPEAQVTAPAAKESTARSQWTPNDLSGTYTEVAVLPEGPVLNSAEGTPELAPIPHN